ncbi:MAG: acetolactate decarboxylase [Candidatus Aureabacteria bacterium]|nr:acetolactate decarboxylase [Candidatus Auribacterota bacterium]
MRVSTRWYRWLILICSFLLLHSSGCAYRSARTITQVGTFHDLSAGGFDGRMSCRRLGSYGNFGIGTFHALDGEMIVTDGKIYQAKSDGKVYLPNGGTTVPFAELVSFAPQAKLILKGGANYAAVEEQINKAVPDRDIFCAIRVRGRFSKMKIRSVPAQVKPYPRLVEVTNHPPVFQFDGVSGTMVGFRSPLYAGEITVPGYHFHFISDDGNSGGHVLEFAIESAAAEIEECDRFLLITSEKGLGGN